MAHSQFVWSSGVFGWWHAAYLRVVRSSFATVPYYRHRWALDGRTAPVLVPGRTGTHGGAVLPADAERAMIDLVPLAGGRSEADPARGLGSVLRPLPSGALVAVLDGAGSRPPAGLPRRVRGCVVDPDDTAANGFAGLTATLGQGGTVLAVGTDDQLVRLAAALPAALAGGLDHRPLRALGRLDDGPCGLIHDRLLGYLGALRGCGHWHLDWLRVHARETTAGLALTLLRQDSPRLVDVLVGDGVPGTITPCPRHGTPVVRA